MDVSVSIIKHDYHRNGHGEGFQSIIFTSSIDGEDVLHASLFDEGGCCAVHNIQLLEAQNIQFGEGGSYRGSLYEAPLRAAIKTMFSETENVLSNR